MTTQSELENNAENPQKKKYEEQKQIDLLLITISPYITW